MVVRPGDPQLDIDWLVEAMPRLAAFELPAWRTDPAELYTGDAAMMRAWADSSGAGDNLVVLVAETGQGATDGGGAGSATLLGFAAVTIQPEFLSGAPGAHLETILVTASAVRVVTCGSQKMPHRQPPPHPGLIPAIFGRIPPLRSCPPPPLAVAPTLQCAASGWRSVSAPILTVLIVVPNC